MKKMWAGRTAGELNKIADKFNASIPFDKRLYRQDITGSIMHAEMLAAKGIIPAAAKDHIIEGLEGILEDLESGKLEVDLTAEDVHMFVEGALTERIGAEGKMLHTARSRNDQVALDLRMYVKEEIEDLQQLVLEMVEALTDKAEEYKKTVMPGYTHLQRAQRWRFVDEMQIGDYVVFADGNVFHIGRIESEYYYDESVDENQSPDYKNTRKVEWLKKDIQRSEVSAALHRSLMTAMSVWTMNDYRAAIADLLNGT